MDKSNANQNISVRQLFSYAHIAEDKINYSDVEDNSRDTYKLKTEKCWMQNTTQTIRY